MNTTVDQPFPLSDEPLIPLIGRRVRAEREAAGLTQQDLARRAGITRVTLSEIENGHREQIKPAVIEAIARVVDRPVRVFFMNDPLVTDIGTLLQQYNLAPKIGMVLLRLVQLPLADQHRVGGLLEQALIWYENNRGE